MQDFGLRKRIHLKITWKYKKFHISNDLLIKNNQVKYRIRNVTKLIFFSMMGYDTEFG